MAATPNRFRQSVSDTADKGKPVYVVSYWERAPETGYPRIVHREHDEVRSARVQYANLPVECEPQATRYDWSEGARQWVATDLVGNAMTPDQARASARRGIKMVRAVLMHSRGHDTRGEQSAGRLVLPNLTDVDNSRGHEHGKGAEHCPRCRRAAAQADPAGCVVCDYLCDHGIEPRHPLAALVQGQLDGTTTETF